MAQSLPGVGARPGRHGLGPLFARGRLDLDPGSADTARMALLDPDPKTTDAEDLSQAQKFRI